MKPEAQIEVYLTTHSSKYEFSTLDLVVQDIKLSLFYGMSPLSDSAIRDVVAKWAAFHAPGLVLRSAGAGASGSPAPSPSTATPASSSELIDAVKKAVKTINDGVTLGKEGANVNLGVTGLTANLKDGASAVSVGVSWTGTLNLNAESGPFHMSGTLSATKWEIVLSFPQDTYIPNIATLGKVFSDTERGLAGIARATRSFNNISDAGKVGALVKPYAGAVQEGVEALSGIGHASKKGGMSFGFKIGSPEPGPGGQGMPGGVQGTVVWTWVF